MNTRNLGAIILVTLVLINVKCIAIPLGGVAECTNSSMNFYLYRNFSETPILLDLINLVASQFLPSRLVNILLHGYNGGLDISPNAEVRPAILQAQSAYVISANYSALVAAPFYPKAVENGVVIAKCLAHLINLLIDGKIVKSEQLHLIGFSLGAQFAGMAAEYTNSQLFRITGLDPAGPLYDTQVSKSQKLDALDATFVDVLHTNPELFGTTNNCGHLDFYANSRSLVQNGCGSNPDVRCSHFRAPAFYAESVTTQTGFVSIFCGSKGEYKLYQCDQYASYPKVSMSYWATPGSINGSYFFETNAASPFAKG